MCYCLLEKIKIKPVNSIGSALGQVFDQGLGRQMQTKSELDTKGKK